MSEKKVEQNKKVMKQPRNHLRHSREGGSPENREKSWIPAFAGMTVRGAGMTVRGAGMTAREWGRLQHLEIVTFISGQILRIKK